jgi:hypothetical protein
MTRLSNIAVRLILSLFVSGTSPAFGAIHADLKSQHGYAHAATQNADRHYSVSPDRAQALRDCNGRIAGLAEHLWGAHRSAIYRACMAEHGEVE